MGRGNLVEELPPSKAGAFGLSVGNFLIASWCERAQHSEQCQPYAVRSGLCEKQLRKPETASQEASMSPRALLQFLPCSGGLYITCKANKPFSLLFTFYPYFIPATKSTLGQKLVPESGALS